jgi:hypothetical protein
VFRSARVVAPDGAAPVAVPESEPMVTAERAA